MGDVSGQSRCVPAQVRSDPLENGVVAVCGIFGTIPALVVDGAIVKQLAQYAEQRGRDSSGLLVQRPQACEIFRAETTIDWLLKQVDVTDSHFLMGHSRLMTNGSSDNQPIYRDGICVIHNGIVVNDEELWEKLPKDRIQESDSEVIAAIIAAQLEKGWSISEAGLHVLEVCRGTISAAIAIPYLGKLMLLSNNGSLFHGYISDSLFFASEAYPLHEVGCSTVKQVFEPITFDMSASAEAHAHSVGPKRRQDLLPSLGTSISEEKQLVYEDYELRRCSRCILPETMPFIEFDNDGACNFCANYEIQELQAPDDLRQIVEPFRKPVGPECIIPFSGGRDSSYALHLIVEELGMRPITYTYDWGMITDLGRRNISRMCAELRVENIIVAADVAKKRRNIRLNLSAWLRSPHLGMLSVLTAGDKHFFQHIDTVRRQTGVSLNLWGINPLETTHFKAGFLGVPPDFEETNVYSRGLAKQLRYQFLRLGAMSQSPRYLNASLWDTWSGEYYRSFREKKDYFHVFDFWKWDEETVEKSLDLYDWERAPDTNATWRIGDGTAAFYNYVYYTAAGLTEHDTFRSNQIREGVLSRDEALRRVSEENRPRYQNIKWYLDAIGMDFTDVVKVVNAMPRPQVRAHA